MRQLPLFRHSLGSFRTYRVRKIADINNDTWTNPLISSGYSPGGVAELTSERALPSAASANSASTATSAQAASTKMLTSSARPNIDRSTSPTIRLDAIAAVGESQRSTGTDTGSLLTAALRVMDQLPAWKGQHDSLPSLIVAAARYRNSRLQRPYQAPRFPRQRLPSSDQTPRVNALGAPAAFFVRPR
jgi:hypothetical protein